MSRPDVHLSAGVVEQALQKRSQFVRDAFQLLDLDGGGSLAVDEMQAVCSVIGLSLSLEEVQDIVNEYDSDASGQIEVDEFVEIVLKHAPSPEQEMRESWKFFDVDKDGCIDKGEVKAGLERVGIKLAPWELREMMEAADTDGDHMISFKEYAAAYGSGPWLRAQGVCGLMTKIMQTWKVLDADNSGNINVEELVRALIPMGSNPDEIAQMVKSADNDGDGEICFKEFLAAYHTNDWFKVRLMSMADEMIGGAAESQRKMYKLQDMVEENDGPLKMTRLLRMKRRGLRRSKEVRVAIHKFWKAVEHHTIGRYWVPKALYCTYNMKLNKAVFKDEEDCFDESELLVMAKEDWTLDLKRNTSTAAGTQTAEMIAREQRGLPPFDPKPDGVDAIPYGVFFDSLFELTDAWMCQTGQIEGPRYGDFITELLGRIITEFTDSNGECMYRWVDNSDSLIAKDESWPLVKQDESEYESICGRGCNLEEMQEITSKELCDAPETQEETAGQAGRDDTRWERKVAAQNSRRLWSRAHTLVGQHRVTTQLVDDFEKLKLLLDGADSAEAREMVTKLGEILTMCSEGGADAQARCEAAMQAIGEQFESMGAAGKFEAFAELKESWCELTTTLGEQQQAQIASQQTAVVSALQEVVQKGDEYEVDAELAMDIRQQSTPTVAEAAAAQSGPQEMNHEAPTAKPSQAASFSRQQLADAEAAKLPVVAAEALSEKSAAPQGCAISHNFEGPTTGRQAAAVSLDDDAQFSLILKPSEPQIGEFEQRLQEAAEMCTALSETRTMREPRLERAALILLELASRFNSTKPVRSHIGGTSAAVMATCRLLRSLLMPLEAECLLALWSRVVAAISQGERADDGFVLWEMKLAQSAEAGDMFDVQVRVVTNEVEKRPRTNKKLSCVRGHHINDSLRQSSHKGRLHRPQEMVVPRTRKAIYQSFGATGAALQVSHLRWPAHAQDQVVTTHRSFSGSMQPATLSPTSEALFSTAASFRLRNKRHPMPFSRSDLTEKACLPMLSRPCTVPLLATRSAHRSSHSIMIGSVQYAIKSKQRCATSLGGSRREPKSIYPLPPTKARPLRPTKAKSTI